MLFSRNSALRLGLVLALVACSVAQAQTLKDPALESLYVAGRFDELQRLSGQRAQANAEDAQAVLGLALAALARDDPATRQSAIGRAQTCLERQAKAAPCQYALGVSLGVQAMSEGMFKAARSAGTVRDALIAAHELEPAWYPARSALIEFYLQAPGMMGGSSSKAAELAGSAPRPEQVKLLEGRIAAVARRYDVAAQSFMAVPAGLEHAQAIDALAWSVQCALGMVNAGQAASAVPLLERVRRDYPAESGPAYALARVRGEAGAHEDASKLYEQAATLKSAGNWPIAYRLGIEQQALGRPDLAKASFARFIAAGKGQKSSLDDARKRLEQLGA